MYKNYLTYHKRIHLLSMMKYRIGNDCDDFDRNVFITMIYEIEMVIKRKFYHLLG